MNTKILVITALMSSLASFTIQAMDAAVLTTKAANEIGAQAGEYSRRRATLLKAEYQPLIDRAERIIEAIRNRPAYPGQVYDLEAAVAHINDIITERDRNVEANRDQINAASAAAVGSIITIVAHVAQAAQDARALGAAHFGPRDQDMGDGE